jgi:hypothetical protein
MIFLVKAGEQENAILLLPWRAMPAASGSPSVESRLNLLAGEFQTGRTTKDDRGDARPM